jgi:hypothetical protein
MVQSRQEIWISKSDGKLEKKQKKTRSIYFGDQIEAETTVDHEHKIVNAVQDGNGIRYSHDKDNAYRTKGPTSIVPVSSPKTSTV